MMMRKYQIRPGVFIEQPANADAPMPDEKLVEYLEDAVKDYMDIWQAAYLNKPKRIVEILGASDQPKKLTNKIDPKTGATALILASRSGGVEVVRILLDRGKAKPNKKGVGGRTALHWACAQGNLDIVELLVGAQAQTDATDDAGNTPLHDCARKGQVRIARVLVEKGANVNASNAEGFTVLMAATISNHTPIIHDLMRFSADIQAQNKDGDTALHLAYRLGHRKMIDTLCKFGASKTVKNNRDLTPPELSHP